ncbi:hypothetical protein D3C86_1924520 [compost metagenome]
MQHTDCVVRYFAFAFGLFGLVPVQCESQCGEFDTLFFQFGFEQIRVLKIAHPGKNRLNTGKARFRDDFDHVS